MRISESEKSTAWSFCVSADESATEISILGGFRSSNRVDRRLAGLDSDTPEGAWRPSDADTNGGMTSRKCFESCLTCPGRPLIEAVGDSDLPCLRLPRSSISVPSEDEVEESESSASDSFFHSSSLTLETPDLRTLSIRGPLKRLRSPAPGSPKRMLFVLRCDFWLSPVSRDVMIFGSGPTEPFLDRDRPRLSTRSGVLDSLSEDTAATSTLSSFSLDWISCWRSEGRSRLRSRNICLTLENGFLDGDPVLLEAGDRFVPMPGMK